MNFNEWLEKNHPNTYAVKDMHGVRDWVAFAEQAWNSAKEVSVPANRGLSDEEYNGIEWYIVGLKDDLERQGFRVNVIS